MLESNRTTDVHSVLIDRTEFLSSRRLMERHRRTFFLPAIDQWVERMDGTPKNAFIWARDQLLGVWAEIALNPATGSAAYERATRSAMYDRVSDAWAENTLVGDASYVAERGLHAELLATLINLQFDADAAVERYERLKNPPRPSAAFYHPRTWRWHRYGIDGAHDLFVTDNLLAALIEIHIDPRDGHQFYESLKQESWYDRERRQWRNPRSDQRTSYAQLLGVLGEWMVDHGSGRALYAALVDTSLYDPCSNEWRHTIHPVDGLNDDRFTMAQLMDVVVRASLNDNGPTTSAPVPLRLEFDRGLR